ncbi:hypothetical protein Poli38472_007779 [Pythium oligandrum]|uniref:Uncharacterized protein n=1 Tax=Pythium oligandrum TaxID=41045 RepID=A0A8K1CQT2_PYTOL|nr:hypothetical protein Poli38472_007779 [Pythium oligandrum]|eukprot:TMW68107.1 hypothetical protein Poli38472_007779 [Pythium oligandrum]
MSALNNTTLCYSLAQSQCPFSDLLREDEWCQSFAAPVSSAASALSINPYPASPTSIDCLVTSHDEYLALLDGTRYPLVEVMDNLKDEERTPPVSPIPFQSNKTPTKREPKVEHTSSPGQNSDHGKLQYVLNSSTSGSSPTSEETREQQRRRQRSYEQKYRTKRRDVLRRSRRQWLQLELQVAQLLRSYPRLYTKHHTTSRAQERYLEGFNEVRARRYDNFMLNKLVVWCDCMKDRNYSADTIRNREDWYRIEQLILGVSVQHPFVPDPFKFTW